MLGRLDKIREGYERFFEFRGNKNYKFITVRTFQELQYMDLNSSRATF
jgi:hypothetical protein